MKKENICAYEVLEQCHIREIDSYGYLLRHRKSGARVLVLENDDENKVFYIGFRTTPTDDTGVMHILEHSVLCGSEKYPVKDPFVELAKGSLNTFLNAMTYPEKTLYPLASCNDQDFKNLMSVYMDAVFYPNIYSNRKIFEQEGWHFELESPEAPLTYNGVVFNEMKGSYSAAESRLSLEIKRALFAGGTYGYSSGGDPVHIPELTYEQFLDTHRKYYHPCNSYIYLYGKMDMEERLQWMDEEYLSKFEKIELDSEIQQAEGFAEWKDVESVYSVTTEEETANKTFLTWNVVVGDVLNQVEKNAYNLLEYALFNAPGAPIKQALLDAGIGMDIDGGYYCSGRQPYFSITARGAEASQKEEFVRIIQEELAKAAANGVNRKSLIGEINNMEFKGREMDYGRWPKGLMCGLNLGNWFYTEEDPFCIYRFGELYDALRERLDSRYYEELIEKMLESTYGAVVVMKPCPGLSEQIDAEEAARLAQIKAGMSEEELAQIAANTISLKEYQQEPSTKEQLETLPMLTREDLSHEVFEPLFEWRDAGAKVLFHPVFTNGIGYLKLGFDARAVELEDVKYLSLVAELLSLVDTEEHSYQDLSDEINIHTGSLFVTLTTEGSAYDWKNPGLRLWIETKVLYRELGWVLNCIREILFTSRFTDKKRIHEMITELHSRKQSEVINGGHGTAIGRAQSYCFEQSYLSAQISGLEFYEFVKQIDEDFENQYELLTAKIREVLEKTLVRDRVLISYTADEEGLELLRKPLAAFAEAIPERLQENANWEFPLVKRNEGLKTPSQVQYVARVGEYKSAGYEYTGAMQVFRTIMDYDYLWIKLRTQGGAYGCFAQLGRRGSGYFCSYRDPKLAETNAVYEGIPAYLEAFDADERDMTRFIIGTISGMDTPMTPAMKGEASLGRYLSGLTIEDVRKEREEILNCTVEDIRALAGPVQALLDQNVLCVVGNAQKIDETEGLFLEKKVLS